jgi:hypothetical protein
VSSYALQALHHDSLSWNVVADAECITVAAKRLYQITLPKVGEGGVEITGVFDTS